MPKQTDQKTDAKQPRKGLVIKQKWPIISNEPYFSRLSTLGLFVILLQLVVVFILMPHYNKTTPFTIVHTSADSEAVLDSSITEAPIANANADVADPSAVAFDSNANVSTISHDIASETDDFNHINSLRNSLGKPNYIQSACLTGIARAWAKAYAAYDVRVHNTQLRNQVKTNCTTNVGAVGENMMAQDTEAHSWSIMTTITGSSVAKVACGDRSTILDTRVPNNPNCSAYPSGYPYGFKYVGIGAFRSPNGLLYLVQDFAGCSSVCRNLPATLASGASTFPNQLRLGETLLRGDKLESGSGWTWNFQSTDGNVVIRSPISEAPWATVTQGKDARRVVFQNDGNLIVYSGSSPPVVLWNSKTAQKGDHVVLQNDGNLVIFSASGSAAWSWKTGLTSFGGCINPLQGYAWRADRTDRGVDYYSGAGQPVKAICNGFMQSQTIPGWGSDNAYIQFKLTSYPPGHSELLGKCIYYAEDITNISPRLNPDGSVHQYKAGDVLGYLNGNTEWGWSASPGSPSSAKAPNDGPTDSGNAFARFLLNQGAPVRDAPGSGPLFAGTPCS